MVNTFQEGFLFRLREAQLAPHRIKAQASPMGYVMTQLDEDTTLLRE